MRIGIVLTGDYNWAGGLYYSLNLIKLLSEISATKKLTVVAIVNASTPPELINDLPKLNVKIVRLHQKSIFYRIYHKIKNDRFVADINALNLDVIYPLIAYDHIHKKIKCRVIYWLYDFQHKFLPQLFSIKEINEREDAFENIANNASDIVFSSHDSLGHFEKYYSNSTCRRHVYNFVSLIDEDEYVQKVEKKYFIVCNQFWPHKNHIIVLQAIKSMEIKGNQPYFVFTGKFNDERNKDYVNELKEFIKVNQLEAHVHFTGFISRKEQIQLIKNSVAVVQPSFFEGWSTVVEDAKALGKFLVLSDLPVHREQVKNHVVFFNPNDSELLSTQLNELLDENPVITANRYFKNIEASRLELIKLFNI